MTNQDNVLFVDTIQHVREAIAEHAAAHSRLFVLCDENTLDHCFPLLANDSEELQNAEILVIEAGEGSKNWEIAHHLFAQLLEFEADKQALIINLGGGVVTDLGGWIAANYKRGIDWINIPTTVMAMIDASIGGKCGIDLMHHKNMVGVIAFPVQTIVCPEFLDTLDPIEILSGQAEMLKHALLRSRNDFDNVCNAIANDATPDMEAIIASASVKLEIVKQDAFETNERKTLNLGHTVGHALESYFISIDKGIPHGIAVAAGIAIETPISSAYHMLSADDSQWITEQCIGLFDLDSYQWPSFDILVPYLMNDKKNSGGKINLALLSDFGDCLASFPVELEHLTEAYETFLHRIKNEA
jgi:3-dehydroquinate synthase